MRFRWALVAATMIVSGHCARAEEPAAEWAKLAGRWKIAEPAGKLDYPWNYISKNGWVVIEKEKVTLLTKEGDKDFKLAVFSAKVDATASQRKVTLTVNYIAPEGEKAKEKGTQLAGIYELRGNVIRIVIGDAKDPPKAFPDKDEGVTKLQREKAK